ncbi:MAG: hypothetical protein DRN71_00345 [Candidatus Nanohalarchaeota archaeon]|nr:MAG: hypothetical protein DRN71_00345 [Candidatus Nanohaloarchaeota archaeon]
MTTYMSAIEYNPDTTFNCTDIKRMMTTYNQRDGPKGYNADLFQDHTAIANIIAAPSFSAVKDMFDCPRYDIIVLDEGTHYTGKVIYTKMI